MYEKEINPDITDKTLDDEALKEVFQDYFGINIDDDNEVHEFELFGELNSMSEVW